MMITEPDELYKAVCDTVPSAENRLKFSISPINMPHNPKTNLYYPTEFADDFLRSFNFNRDPRWLSQTQIEADDLTLLDSAEPVPSWDSANGQPEYLFNVTQLKEYQEGLYPKYSRPAPAFKEPVALAGFEVQKAMPLYHTLATKPLYYDDKNHVGFLADKSQFKTDVDYCAAFTELYGRAVLQVLPEYRNAEMIRNEPDLVKCKVLVDENNLKAKLVGIQLSRALKLPYSFSQECNQLKRYLMPLDLNKQQFAAAFQQATRAAEFLAIPMNKLLKPELQQEKTQQKSRVSWSKRSITPPKWK